MFSLIRFRRIVGAAFLAALVSAPLQAANVPTPRDELLRFVPEDVGFCVIVQNLRDNGKALEESPFAEQFRKSAVGQRIQSDPGLSMLRNMEGVVKDKFGIDWKGLRDDILGDAVIFAYRPGKMGEGQELMLIRARNAKTLADLVDRVNKMENLKELKELEYKGVKYFSRIDKRETGYYHLRGPILVYSSQEEMLKRAIDLDLAANGNGTPTLTSLLRKLGADNAMLAVYFNTRAFDSEVAGKLATKDDPVFKTLLVYWKAVDAVVVSLTLDRDATLAVGVAGRSTDLPESARRFFDTLAKPSDLWRQIPDDALFAVGGRVDFAALAEMIGDNMRPEDRKRVHTLARSFLARLNDKDLMKDVLTRVGPEWALWVTAPKDTAHLLPVALFALRVGGGDKVNGIEKAILDQISDFSVLAVFAHSHAFPDKPLVRKTGTFDKQDVNYLEGGILPAGVRPAFALKDGFLLLASAPEQIGRFMASTPTTSEGPAPLLRVSFKAWRTYLESRKDGLVKFFVEKDQQLTPEQAGERIDTVLSVLAFVDNLEVRHKAGTGYAVVSIVIQTAQPLKR
jgi:hypothetical protein